MTRQLGSADQLLPLLPLVIVLAVVLSVWGLNWLFQRRRARSIAEAAGSIGFFPAPEDSVSLPEMHLFSLGRDAAYRNVLRGSAGGLDTVIFDYSYEHGHGKNRQTTTQTVAAFHAAGANMPDFQVFPRRIVHRIASFFGKQDLRFEANPEFSQRYVVRGSDSISTSAFFTAGILAFFAGRLSNPFTIEGYHDWLIIYTPGKTVRVSAVRDFLELTSELASGILNQVPRPLSK